MTYILIIIGAIFVNNIVLSKFLGVCPFLGVSKKTSTAVGMTGAVLFVMTIATIITWLLQKYVLLKFDIVFLQTITFILVIAALVQMVEIILKKVSPPLYQALGIFLPLITTNCAVLGVAIMAGNGQVAGVEGTVTLLHSVVFAIANAIGFGLALVLFSGLREHIDFSDIPKAMKGAPIALIVAGILALAFMGFAGLA
jgi:H+/Na+-translocating ferredoxin:NAD+ oxidoreductase subunit A